MSIQSVTNTTFITSTRARRDIEHWSADHPGLLGIDTETDGTWTASVTGAIPEGELRCLSFSDGVDSISLAPRVHPGPLLRHPLVAHNAYFDCRWVAHVHGVDLVDLMMRCDDSLTAARQIEPWRHFTTGFALKVLGAEILGQRWRRTWDAIVDRYGIDPLTDYEQPTDDEEDDDDEEEGPRRRARERVEWDAINFEDAATYCADDAAQTVLLFRHFTNTATDADIAVLDFERRLDAWLAGRVARGYWVDVARARRYADHLDRLRSDATEALAGMGMPRATDTTLRAVLAAMNAPLAKQTKRGAYSVDKEVRSGLVLSGGPWAEMVLTYGAVKDANAWIAKLEKLVPVVHPEIKARGAVSWRWIVQAPPVHTMPKRPKTLADGTAADLRTLFMADAGTVLVSADYSAMEFAVCAGLADDEAMLASLDNPYMPLTHELGISLDVAKIVVLGGQYGMGARKLAVQLGTTTREAQILRAGIWGGNICPEDCRNPDPTSEVCRTHGAFRNGQFNVRPFRAELLSDMTDDGCAVWTNPFGRRIALDGSKALAYAVQGTSRDITMRALDRALSAGLDVTLAIHDEILIQAPPDEADEAGRELERMMAAVVGDAVLHAEAEVLGPRWRSTKAPTIHAAG
jgi:DNA polymerase-1